MSEPEIRALTYYLVNPDRFLFLFTTQRCTYCCRCQSDCILFTALVVDLSTLCSRPSIMSSKIPLEMAQCAKDKLQASAQQIWSTIRSFDDTNNPTTATNNGEQQQQHCTSAEGTSSAQAQSSAAENTAAMSLEKIENVLKVMFGSCTAGIPMPYRSPPSEPVPTSTATGGAIRRSRSSRSRDFVYTRDMGEHVYEQLFMDDQARATRAVEGLRAKSASTPTSTKSPSRHFSSYFGVNNNTPTGHNIPAAPVSPAMPLAATDIDVNGDFDFDDGISAISNNTLEEMAMVHDHRQSISPSKRSTAESSSRKNSTHRTGVVDTISHPRSTRSRRTEPSSQQTATPPPAKTKSQATNRSPLPVHPMPSMMTPIKVSRGPSHVTVGTKTSKGTKSTSSTQDSHSEFASVWQKDEKAFWNNEVEKEKKAMRKGSGRSSTKSRRRSRSTSHSVSILCTTIF